MDAQQVETFSNRISDHQFVRNAVGGLRIMLSNRETALYFYFLLTILLMGIFGPYVAPYQYDETLYGDDDRILRGTPPSLEHPLGTTDVGQDVLSRILYGARPTVITGLIGGTLIVTIGLTIGVTAGYVGGWVDDLLMRFTDIVYSIPLIPFAIVMAGFIGVGFIESILMIGLLLWRGNARVLRSQVLQIKERPFILSAKASGASTPRIIFKHILPNIAPMAVLFFALGTGYSIILQAGLSFVGVSTPFIPSWGIMIRNAYNSGMMSQAWAWSLAPGFLIALTVLSLFMFGRGYEQISSGGQDEAIAVAG